MLISLDPALPEPTEPRLRLLLQQQLRNGSSLCTGAGGVTSIRGELAKGGTKTKTNPPLSPLFWVSRSR